MELCFPLGLVGVSTTLNHEVDLMQSQLQAEFQLLSSVWGFYDKRPFL